MARFLHGNSRTMNAAPPPPARPSSANPQTAAKPIVAPICARLHVTQQRTTLGSGSRAYRRLQAAIAGQGQVW